MVLPVGIIKNRVGSLRTNNLKLYEYDANTLSLENLAGGTYKGLRMGGLLIIGTGIQTCEYDGTPNTDGLTGISAYRLVTEPADDLFGAYIQVSGSCTVAANTNTGTGIESNAVVAATNNKNWTHAQALAGARCGVDIKAGATGTFAFGAAFYAQNIVNGGIVTALYGLYVRNAIFDSATITTQYGVYIETQTNAVTNWGIYVNSNDSYFGGKVGIGVAATKLLTIYTATPAVVLNIIDNAVAHGMTTIAATNVISQIGDASSDGGLSIQGLAQSTTQAIIIQAANVTASTTVPVMQFRAHKKSGTTIGALAAGDYAFEFLSHTTSILSLLGDGTMRTQKVGVNYAMAATEGNVFTVASDTSAIGSFNNVAYGNHANPVYFTGRKTKNAAPTAHTVVATGEQLVAFLAQGSDGTVFRTSSAIAFFCEGTIGDNRVPGRIEFWTTTDVNPGVSTKWVTLNSAGLLTLSDGVNIAADTTTGTKIGTATSQKLGFWAATPVIQQAHIADPTDLATCITAITSINALCATLGLTAAS